MSDIIVSAIIIVSNNYHHFLIIIVIVLEPSSLLIVFVGFLASMISHMAVYLLLAYLLVAKCQPLCGASFSGFSLTADFSTHFS